MLRVPLLVALLAAAPLACAARPAPPAARPEVPGVARAESTFTGASGLELYAQSWRPAAPRAVLVVVHGLKDHSARYEALAQRMVREGFAVHGLDLRGHGRSPGERSQVAAIADYVADLTIFVERVKQAEPGLPVFLFGHSMGGAIATTFVLEHPDAAQGLVLSAAALQLGPEVSPGLVRVTRKLGRKHPTWRVLKLKPKYFSHDAAVVAAVKGGDPLVDPKKIPASTAAALIDAIERIQADAKDLRLPLLVLHGEADRITPPAGSRAVHERATSGDKTLKIYPGDFHDLLSEPDRAQILEDIAGWLVARAQPVAAAPAEGAAPAESAAP